MLLRLVLAIGTWFWALGIIVGLTTAAILFVADRMSPRRHGDAQE